MTGQPSHPGDDRLPAEWIPIPGRELAPRTNTIVRRVTGTPEHVQDMVAKARRSGQLVAMTRPRRDAQQRVYVDVRLIRVEVLTPPPAPAAPSGIRVSRLAAVLIVTAAFTVLGLAIYVVVTLVNAVAAVLPLVVVALALLGGAALLSGGGKSGTWKVGR